MLTLKDKAVIKGLLKENKNTEAATYVASKHKAKYKASETPVFINNKKFDVRKPR